MIGKNVTVTCAVTTVSKLRSLNEHLKSVKGPRSRRGMMAGGSRCVHKHVLANLKLLPADTTAVMNSRTFIITADFETSTAGGECSPKPPPRRLISSTLLSIRTPDSR